MKILPLIVTILFVSFVGSQVIGIDLGTQFWKASLISPGKNLVIVENSRSSRKSNNGIAFLQGIRHFEYDALTKRMKKPKVSYFYLNKLIESLDHEKPLEGYHFQNGTYFFKEGDDTISLEQMVAMIIKNIKKYSSQQAGSDIKDSVLTVPAHWGFKAKFSLINAASLAELSVLGLVNENSAAAIHFAITRNDSDPVNIGFFNMGSHNLQVSIVQFFGTVDPVREKNIESMRVLSHVSISNFGGLQIDTMLAEYVAEQFQKKHKLDVHENLKSWTKLLHKCADLKETLSANKEANIYIEGIMNGIDLNINVKREVLQSSPIFSQLQAHLKDSLDKAGIKKQQLHSVQVIGGNSRIPFVGKILKQFYDPIQVGSHINGDESMAFGAALRAANLSIAFRVKQLHFYDGNPEVVRVVITNVEDGVLSQNTLFDKDSEQGLRKEVVVDENKNDVKVSVYYGEDLVQQYLLANISSWEDRYNRSALNLTEEPKLVLVFAAHSFNFAELKEAYINITTNTTTTREVVELEVENVTMEEKESSEEKKEEGEAENDEEKKEENQSPKEEEKKEQTDNSSDEQKKEEEANESTSNSSEKKQKKKRTRERTKSVKKIVQESKVENKKFITKFSHESSKYHRLNKEQLEQLRQVIHKYEKHENYLKEKSKVRNDFESTLYSLKEDFENPGLKTYSTQNQLQKLKSSVIEQLSWLDDNAWTAEKDEFESHFRTIQDIYLPIVNRSSESRDRQKYYNKTIEIMSLVYQKTMELNSSQPWVQEKAEDHLRKINDTVEWIHGQLKKQMALQSNEDIVFYNHQMIDKAEDLRDQYYLIKMIPRPKVSKKKAAEAPKEPKADQSLDLGDDEEEKPEQNAEGTEQSQESAEDGSKKEDASKEDL